MGKEELSESLFWQHFASMEQLLEDAISDRSPLQKQVPAAEEMFGRKKMFCYLILAQHLNGESGNTRQH